MRKELFFISFIFLINGISSYAGDKAYGGDGLIMGDRIYLLDLVESGVEERPYFKPNVTINNQILSRVKKALIELRNSPNEKIAMKLTELSQIHPGMVWALLETMEIYRWVTVSSSLLDVPDKDTNLLYSSKDKVQLAIRRRRTIMLDRNIWLNQFTKKINGYVKPFILDEAQKVALIFHELLYALTQPRLMKDHYFEQSAAAVRELTGYIFSPIYEKNKLLTLLRNDFNFPDSKLIMKSGEFKFSQTTHFYPLSLEYDRVMHSSPFIYAALKETPSSTYEWSTTSPLLSKKNFDLENISMKLCTGLKNAASGFFNTLDEFYLELDITPSSFFLRWDEFESLSANGEMEFGSGIFSGYSSELFDGVKISLIDGKRYLSRNQIDNECEKIVRDVYAQFDTGTFSELMF